MPSENPSWNASDYKANSSAQLGWGLGVLAQMKLPSDARVLDVGCGDGRITREIARLVPQGRVLGIDASADMITLARESFPETANLSFECMDARRIVLPEKFDVVFSNAALHWFREHDAFLSGLRACLNPGARLVFSFAGKGNAGEMVKALFGTIRREKWRTYFQREDFTPEKLPYAFFSPEEYSEILRRNGFEPESVELVHRVMRQAGRPGLAGWFRTTWMPFTGHVPEALREEFIAEVVETYATMHPEEADGSLLVDMYALVVRARRT